MNIQDIQYLRQETGAGIMDCKNALSHANGDIQQSLVILREKGFQLVKKKAERAAADGIAYAEVFGDRAVLLEVNTETDFVSGNDEFISYVRKIAQAIARHTPEDAAGLMGCALEGQEMTVADLVQRMVLTFRENIVIRRFEVLYGDILYAYMHQKGRYGVILSLAADRSCDHARIAEIGKELAMQIAAMAPLYVSRSHLTGDAAADILTQIVQEVAEDDTLAGKPHEVIGRIVSGRVEKYYRTYCLMEQAYIKDDSITVQLYLQKTRTEIGGQLQVMQFFRYKKAEGLQDDEAPDNLAYARQMART